MTSFRLAPASYQVETGQHRSDWPYALRSLGSLFSDEGLGFDGFVTPVKAKSREAAGQIKDVDAVYLDAAHDYASVAADIRAWLPKNRRPGWIMGHDYDLSAVRQAVLELLGPPDRTTGRTWAKHLGN